MQEKSEYWFPAKRYGWGWGSPKAWQGRVVIAVFVLLAVGAVFLFPPERNLRAFLFALGGLFVLLLGICWAKGEPPRWRWGGE